MDVLDVFVVPIHIVPTIVNIPSHYIHLIVNVLYLTIPLTLPFITTKWKRLRETLHLVVNVGMKQGILEEAAILILDVLEVLLVDGVIHNIPSCVGIMLFHVRIKPYFRTYFPFS
jgi:hypothetical protein